MLNKKKQRFIAGIICGILVIAMLAGIVASFAPSI